MWMNVIYFAGGVIFGQISLILIVGFLLGAHRDYDDD